MEIAEDVENVFAPGPRGQIALLKVRDQGSIEKKRTLMLNLVRVITANKQKVKDDDCEEGTLWAGPSKPVHILILEEAVSRAEVRAGEAPLALAAKGQRWWVARRAFNGFFLLVCCMCHVKRTHSAHVFSRNREHTKAPTTQDIPCCCCTPGCLVW